MPNITYRSTASPILPVSTTVKGSPLTNAEIDANWKVFDNDIVSVKTDILNKANTNSPTFTGTVSGITKSMVGLSNVDNTTDASVLATALDAATSVAIMMAIALG